MNTAQRIVKNTSVQIAGKVVTAVIGLTCTVLIARYLGPLRYGQYAFVFAYLVFFGVLCDLGIVPIAVREISKDETKASVLIGTVMMLKGLIALVAAAFAAIIINFIECSPTVIFAVYFASLSLFFFSIRAADSIFQAKLRMEYVTIANIIDGITRLLFVFLLFYLHSGGVISFVLASILGGLAGSVVVYSFARRFINPVFKIDLEEWKFILKESIPLGLAIILVTIYFNIDMLMLSTMKGYRAVGFYSAAYKFLSLAIFIPGVFAISVFPLMSKFYVERSKEKLLELYEKSFHYMGLISLPIAVCVTLLASPIILLVYGQEYANSIVALQVLIWAAIPIFASSISGYMLVSINQQKMGMIIAGIGAVVNIGLNLVLIPRFSFIGAAWATIITEVWVLAGGVYFVFKFERLLPSPKFLPKIILLSIVLGLLTMLFRSLNVLILIPLVGALYFLLIWLFRCIPKEDWESLVGARSR